MREGAVDESCGDQLQVGVPEPFEAFVGLGCGKGEGHMAEGALVGEGGGSEGGVVDLGEGWEGVV